MKGKKRYLVAFLLAIAFTGAPAFAATNQSNNQTIEQIQFVSGNTGGSWLSIAAVIADRVNQYYQNFPVTAVPGGAIANLPVLANGDAQIGMSQGPFMAAALKGKPPYEKPITGIKSICALVPTVVYFMADVRMKEDTVDEMLKNKVKMAIGTTPKGNSSGYVLEYVFEKCGIKDMQEVKKYGAKIVYADQASLKDAWSDGHIDFYSYNTSMPSAVINEFLTIRKGKLLGLKESTIKKLVKDYGFIETTIPAGMFPGQEKAVETIGIPSIVIARADAPDDLVFNIAKVVSEQKSYLEAAQSSFKTFDVREMPKGVVFPIHPGALKYYKEKGLVK